MLLPKEGGHCSFEELAAFVIPHSHLGQVKLTLQISKGQQSLFKQWWYQHYKNDIKNSVSNEGLVWTDLDPNPAFLKKKVLRI